MVRQLLAETLTLAIIGSVLGVGLGHMGVHLHDLHGLGLVNSLISYQLGIRTFDCSVGGIGSDIGTGTCGASSWASRPGAREPP